MTMSRFLNGAEASRQYGVLAGHYAASLLWTDPLADAAVESLLPVGKSWWSVVLKALDAGTGGVSDVPPAVAALIAALPPEPGEERWAAIERGRAAIARTGNSASSIIQCVSLVIDGWSPPVGYSPEEAIHGLAQTFDWWVKLHAPGGLHRGADGYKATLRVRLDNAFRRRLVRGSGSWDRRAWGEPFNQGDLFFEVSSLTAVMLDGLHRMGYRLTPPEKEGYYAFWRHAAAVLGLHKTWLEMIDAERCGQFWKMCLLVNPPPDAGARARAARTLEALAGAGGGIAFLERSRLAGLTHWLLGRDVAQGLGMAGGPMTYLLQAFYPPTSFLSQRLGGSRERRLARTVTALTRSPAPPVSS
jgi:hypothetical protein